MVCEYGLWALARVANQPNATMHTVTLTSRQPNKDNVNEPTAIRAVVTPVARKTFSPVEKPFPNVVTLPARSRPIRWGINE